MGLLQEGCKTTDPNVETTESSLVLFKTAHRLDWKFCLMTASQAITMLSLRPLPWLEEIHSPLLWFPWSSPFRKKSLIVIGEKSRLNIILNMKRSQPGRGILPVTSSYLLNLWKLYRWYTGFGTIISALKLRLSLSSSIFWLKKLTGFYHKSTNKAV